MNDEKTLTKWSDKKIITATTITIQWNIVTELTENELDVKITHIFRFILIPPNTHT